MTIPRLLVLTLLTCAAWTGVMMAQEAVTLSTPIVKTATSCALDSVLLDVKGLRIVVALSCNNGDTTAKQYDATTAPTGAALLSSLNVSANSSVNSLIRKVYARLIADGVVVGSVTGIAQ